MKNQSETDLLGAGTASAAAPADALYGRVASILEQARTNVVRAVNHNMVVAYWAIGREIVMELQRGHERAGYGQKIVRTLSERLTTKFGIGYSVENLWIFRRFYLAYGGGQKIMYTPCTELDSASGETLSGGSTFPDFKPELSWSHYRALIRVADSAARSFYEAEAVSAGWSVRDLERQIHSHYYERLLIHRGRPRARPKPGQDGPGQDVLPPPCPVPVNPQNPIESMKDPCVFEFSSRRRRHA